MNYSLQGMYGLTGRTAMVTGAAGQLGSAMVDGLLALGARCVATDTAPEALEATAAKRGWDADCVVLAPCDIRERAQVGAALDKGIDSFGEVDCLVNNAGVSVFEPWLERPESSVDWVTGVNLKGTIVCVQEFVSRRQALGERSGQLPGGSMVAVASHYGLISPDPRIYTDCERKNSEIYGATKAGIIQMTRYWAVHAAGLGIRANAISPGGVRNPDSPQGPDFQANYGFRCPMGRMAEIGEMVGAVCFLLSPAASYINGHNLVIDGGMTCW